MAHFIPLNDYKLTVVEAPSTFRPPFTISETGEIAAAATGGTAYNGTAVRLESIVLDKETGTAVLGVSLLPSMTCLPPIFSTRHRTKHSTASLPSTSATEPRRSGTPTFLLMQEFLRISALQTLLQ